MSISPIGSVSSVQPHTAPAAVKAEPGLTPGSPDRNASTGTGGAPAAATEVPSVKPGSVDVRA